MGPLNVQLFAIFSQNRCVLWYVLLPFLWHHIYSVIAHLCSQFEGIIGHILIVAWVVRVNLHSCWNVVNFHNFSWVAYLLNVKQMKSPHIHTLIQWRKMQNWCHRSPQIELACFACRQVRILCWSHYQDCKPSVLKQSYLHYANTRWDIDLHRNNINNICRPEAFSVNCYFAQLRLEELIWCTVTLKVSLISSISLVLDRNSTTGRRNTRLLTTVGLSPIVIDVQHGVGVISITIQQFQQSNFSALLWLISNIDNYDWVFPCPPENEVEHLADPMQFLNVLKTGCPGSVWGKSCHYWGCAPYDTSVAPGL